jgi:hypothetical protein
MHKMSPLSLFSGAANGHFPKQISLVVSISQQMGQHQFSFSGWIIMYWN